MKLSKNLKKGGILIIYVPALKILFSSMDRLVGHYRRYSLSMLKELTNDAGVEVVHARYCDPVGFMASIAYKVSSNKKGTITPSSVKIYDRLLFPISKTIEPLFRNVGGKNALMVVRNE